MKVLHLLGGHLKGGAALAALEIHQALLDSGIDSRMLQSQGPARRPDRRVLATGRVGRRLGHAASWLDRRLGGWMTTGGDGRYFSPGVFGASVRRFADEADILHLHWINDGGFRLPLLGRVPKPIVWTLHDMWSLTGGCHYAFDCDGFATTCRNCPAAGGSNIPATLQRLKARAVGGRVHFVAISSWMARQAERSVIARGCPITVIPNLVDTEVFRPMPRAEARMALGLDPSRSVVLAGHASGAYQKGNDLLAAAVAQMRARGVAFDLVGFGAPGTLDGLHFDRHFGYVSDRAQLRLLYAAADVFAFPSRTEAFGRTIIEAMACGTPVVAFAGSGPDDIIEPEKTGVLASPFDIGVFSGALSRYLTADPVPSGACVEVAKTAFGRARVAIQYISLYRKSS